MNLPNLKQDLLRTRVLVLRPWFLGTLLVIFLLIPTQAYARTTTYIGNYEVTTEDNGTKKETVRVAGTMGKVVKSRETTQNNRAVEKTWNYSYYTTDQQGSTRQEISESVITNTPVTPIRQPAEKQSSIPKPNTYYAYGTPISSHPELVSGSVLNAQKQVVEDTYTGQKKDEETNLMYYNARYYNPQTGLFIQADSVDDGQNKYQYVAGNPINNTDPSGNDGEGNETPVEQLGSLQQKFLENYLHLDNDSELKDPAFQDLIFKIILSIDDSMTDIQIINRMSSIIHDNIPYSKNVSYVSRYAGTKVKMPYSYQKSGNMKVFQEETGEELVQFNENWSAFETQEYSNRALQRYFKTAYETSLANAFLSGTFICGNFAELTAMISNEILEIGNASAFAYVTSWQGPHAATAYEFNGELYFIDSQKLEPFSSFYNILNNTPQDYYDWRNITWEWGAYMDDERLDYSFISKKINDAYDVQEKRRKKENRDKFTKYRPQ